MCISRAFVGYGEAIAPSAATDMVARAALSTERARSVTFIFAGLHVGSIVGLLATPFLVSTVGWRPVFFSFGSLGLVWWLWFEKVGVASHIYPDVVLAR
jgi:ACS family sodium-dependent inorganic phosphate cotransporter